MERLDKIIAGAFGLTRAQARKEILAGRVTVQGTVCRSIAAKVDPEQPILLNGAAANYQKFSYILLNKPAGVLSASADKRQKTVLDLLPPELKRHGLFPVGRLDKNTTGLLLITNDGDFAHRLLAPAKKVPKVYLATLDGPITEQVVQGYKAGVTLADGTKLSPAGLSPAGGNTVRVEIYEGKYHQIKRMFGVFQLGVNALQRISFAGLSLPPNLLPGQARPLTAEELYCIKNTIFC